MACRLVNCTKAPLRIDLRGGVTMQLAPGATSPALAEEQLYDNMFVQQWERDGLIVRLPARYSEVVGEQAPARKPSVRREAEADVDSDEKGDKKEKKSKRKNAS